MSVITNCDCNARTNSKSITLKLISHLRLECKKGLVATRMLYCKIFLFVVKHKMFLLQRCILHTILKVISLDLNFIYLFPGISRRSVGTNAVDVRTSSELHNRRQQRALAACQPKLHHQKRGLPDTANTTIQTANRTEEKRGIPPSTNQQRVQGIPHAQSGHQIQLAI